MIMYGNNDFSKFQTYLQADPARDRTYFYHLNKGLGWYWDPHSCFQILNIF